MSKKLFIENPEFGVFKSVAFVSSGVKEANDALKKLTKKFPNTPLEEADVIVALGGDGFMLECLHQAMKRQHVPVYGMNCGSVGFLMNKLSINDLLEKLTNALPATLHPLKMRAIDKDKEIHEALAINEVSLFRQTRQAAKVKISIDGRMRMPELICDGVLASTTAGSTAYNLSAHGPIVPIDANVICLTPISAFRPRRWRGALLPKESRITFDILEHQKRPVSAVADHTEIRRVVKVDISEDLNNSVTILFDPEHNMEERIITEQFLT